MISGISSLPGADKEAGQTAGGQDDQSLGGIISSVEAPVWKHSSLSARDNEDKCEANGVSYIGGLARYGDHMLATALKKVQGQNQNMLTPENQAQ